MIADSLPPATPRRIALGAVAVTVVVTVLGLWSLSGGPGADADPSSASADATLTLPDGDGFHDVTDRLGLQYGFRYQSRFPGNGVYVGDVDGDGAPDIVALGGEAPALYLHDGDGYDRETLPDAATADDGRFTSASLVDLDVDSHGEVLLLGPNRSLLLEHTPEGVATSRPIADPPFTMPVAAAAADQDGDGCPDVVVAESADIE